MASLLLNLRALKPQTETGEELAGESFQTTALLCVLQNSGLSEWAGWVSCCEMRSNIVINAGSLVPSHICKYMPWCESMQSSARLTVPPVEHLASC